jgi:hypothetical protein
MNSARVLELAGDNFFVIASVIGSVAIIGYLLFHLNRKAKNR